MKKRISLAVLLCLLCQFFPVSGVPAKNSSLDDLKNQQQEAQKEAKELAAAKKKLEKTLGNLDSELYRLSASLNDVEDEIAQIELSISDTEEELRKAKELERKQYKEMKLRIQFMYETGNSSLWEMMTGASSFTDLLNKTEYVKAINRYDRTQMDAYLDNLSRIRESLTQLEKEEAELHDSRQKLEQKQKDLQTAITRTKKKIDAAGTKVKDNKKEQEELAKKIAAMEEYERKLAEKRAREEAKRLAELKRQEAELAATQAGPMTVSEAEEYLLACIIYCEAGAESYEGQLGVGSVVLNRVRSKYYPNDITSVVYQSGQFSPAWSGRLALTLERGPSASCKKAAKEVLGGHITGPWIGFCYPRDDREGTIIGKIMFF